MDGDGDVDVVSKPWGGLPWNGLGGTMHVDLLENLLRAPRSAAERERRPRKE